MMRIGSIVINCTEDIVSKLKLAFAAVALTVATSLFSSAQAIPSASAISNGLRSGSETRTMIEQVQYVRNGKRHCWYQSR